MVKQRAPGMREEQSVTSLSNAMTGLELSCGNPQPVNSRTANASAAYDFRSVSARHQASHTALRGIDFGSGRM